MESHITSPIAVGSRLWNLREYPARVAVSVMVVIMATGCTTQSQSSKQDARTSTPRAGISMVEFCRSDPYPFRHGLLLFSGTTGYEALDIGTYQAVDLPQKDTAKLGAAPTISPDGERLVSLLQSDDGRAAIARVTTPDWSGTDHALPSIETIDSAYGTLRWRNAHIVEYGIEASAPTVRYALDIDTNTETILSLELPDRYRGSTSEPPYANMPSNWDFVISPTGTQVVYLAFDSGDQLPAIRLYDLERREVIWSHTFPSAIYSVPAWKPDGTGFVVGIETEYTIPDDLPDVDQTLVYVDDAGAMRTLVEHVPALQKGVIRGIIWAPDQNKLSYWLPTSGFVSARLAILDIPGRRLLFSCIDDHNSVSEQSAAWAPDSELLAASFDDANSQRTLYSLHLADNAFWALPLGPFDIRLGSTEIVALLQP